MPHGIGFDYKRSCTLFRKTWRKINSVFWLFRHRYEKMPCVSPSRFVPRYCLIGNGKYIKENEGEYECCKKHQGNNAILNRMGWTCGWFFVDIFIPTQYKKCRHEMCQWFQTVRVHVTHVHDCIRVQ